MNEITNLCTHLDQATDVLPSDLGCEDCLRAGKHNWVHLRMCRVCGHVGCCDFSPGKHATNHYKTTGHPLISSYEPGEAWWWCYEDELMTLVPDEPDYDYTTALARSEAVSG